MNVTVVIANDSHTHFAEHICEMMSSAAKIRGTGIAKREHSYISSKMSEGKAVIALSDNKLVGFCYIESWEGQKYVANSGLIVHPDFRKTGLAKKIKTTIFDLSKEKFPDSKLFGITTSLAVMKINSLLGYKPVTFSELTADETFWKGCQNCTNYDILQRTNKTMCLCTAMVCDLKTENSKNKTKTSTWVTFKSFLKERKTRLKNYPIINKLINNDK